MMALSHVAIATDQLNHNDICLTPQQQHYLFRVLRLKRGDRFIALIEQQWWLSCLHTPEIAQRLELIPAQTELPLPVILMVALPKTGMEDIVRSGTELGVSQIIPIISDRTLLQPSPQKIERWRRIATEAAEQSERQHIPIIVDPLPFCQTLDIAPHRFLCVARGNAPHLLTLPLPPPWEPLAIATGPEGGWTTAEIEQALQAGFQPVSLGKRILRAITAPLVAVALIAADYESK